MVGPFFGSGTKYHFGSFSRTWFASAISVRLRETCESSRRSRYEKRTWHIFCISSKKGWKIDPHVSLEPKISSISLSRGSGPPFTKTNYRISVQKNPTKTNPEAKRTLRKKFPDILLHYQIASGFSAKISITIDFEIRRYRIILKKILSVYFLSVPVSLSDMSFSSSGCFRVSRHTHWGDLDDNNEDFWDFWTWGGYD